MKISTENTRTEVTRTVSQLVDMTGRTIIYSRCPVFALTTGLSCLLTAWLLLLQGSWKCSGALIAISTWMGIWQTRIVFNSPILMIRGLLVTLYREGEDASIFMLGDLKVVEGNLTTGLAVLAVALIGVALGTIVLFPDFDASMSLSLYPTQRLLFIMLESGSQGLPFRWPTWTFRVANYSCALLLTTAPRSFFSQAEGKGISCSFFLKL
jgi:hypothetical protein